MDSGKDCITDAQLLRVNCGISLAINQYCQRQYNKTEELIEPGDGQFPALIFAILDFAKSNASPMKAYAGVVAVDGVKCEPFGEFNVFTRSERSQTARLDAEQRSDHFPIGLENIAGLNRKSYRET